MSSASAVALRERLVLLHAGFVTIAASWLLGGIGPLNEWIVAALSAPALLFLFQETLHRRRSSDRAGLRRLALWSAPLLALAALVLVSALNPSHRPAFLYDTYVLRPVPHVEWLPASARPLESLRTLACLGGLAATGLALAFCVHSRSALQNLVLALALNTLLLAVVGTLQSQGGAAGPWFGLVTSPNKHWFASFLYHNHWGAFATLGCAAALALVFHSLRHPPARGWFHGPGPLLTLAAFLIAATGPLSNSRSTTVLLALLCLAAAWRSWRHLARTGRPLLGALIPLAGVALLAGIILFQSREIIAERVARTTTEWVDLRDGQTRYTRPELYADTWRMAADKPLFGWGLESYGPIFLNYNTTRPDINGVVTQFEDAHSDWLQSLAEIGFAGTALLLLAALLPLADTLRHARPGPLPSWLLGGCALVALYAWVEFPFANPAVVALWWTLYFTALRLARLTATPAPACSPSSSSR
jgi:O-antigen ligase